VELITLSTPELSEADKEIFNRLWQVASKKDEDIFAKGDIRPQDWHFFLKDTSSNQTVAVGRYRCITGIKIGDQPWEQPVWGLANVSTDPEHQGQGYGKQLVTGMIDFAQKRGLWPVGFHGKKTTLSEFYGKCGLEVDENIGLKMHYPKEGELVPHHKVAVSYRKGDPFIEAVRKTTKKVCLPHSW